MLSRFKKLSLSAAILLLPSLAASAAERTATIKVYGMDCPSCAKGVAGSLKSLKGVKAADVSVEKAHAVVTYEDTEVTLEQLRKRIEASGYPTTPKKV